MTKRVKRCIMNYHGTNYIRSLKKIWSFEESSASLVSKEDSQGAPGSDYRAGRDLVDRRSFPQALPQASSQAGPQEEDKKYLTLRAYTLIIPLVSDKELIHGKG